MAGGWQVPEQEPGPAPGLAFAGYGERLVAYIVDAIIVTIVVIVVSIVGGLVIGAGAVSGSASAAVGGGIAPRRRDLRRHDRLLPVLLGAQRSHAGHEDVQPDGRARQ